MKDIHLKIYKIELVILVLLLNNWLLAPFLNSRLFMLNGSISDYSALTQPHHNVFRYLDILAGLILLAIIFFLAKSRTIKFDKIMLVVAAILAISNILDALMPLSCVGAVDAACTNQISISVHSLVLPHHVFSSFVFGLCTIALPYLGIGKFKKDASPQLYYLSIATLGVSLVFLTALGLNAHYNGDFFYRANGIAQYVQILILGIWFMVWLNIPNRKD